MIKSVLSEFQEAEREYGRSRGCRLMALEDQSEIIEDEDELLVSNFVLNLAGNE
jgi:hypothetical protein